MSEVNTLDRVAVEQSQVGDVRKLTDFGSITNDNGDGTSAVEWQNGYLAKEINALALFLGIQTLQDDVVAGAEAAGQDPDKIFFQIVYAPSLVGKYADEDAIDNDVVSAAAEENWIAAFGDLNDPDGVALADTQFIRVS